MTKEKSGLGELLERASFTMKVDKKPAAEITIQDKKVIIEAKDAFLLMELGMKAMKEKDAKTKLVLKMAKMMGYKVVVRYQGMELEL